MKRALVLHSTGSNPSAVWYPWLKAELEQRGYDVFAPLLPDSDRPNRQTYEQFLRDSGWDFTDNLVVGHSSGATTALNLLLSDWFPPMKATVLVGTFLNQKLTKPLEDFPEGIFDGLFVETFDPDKLSQKSPAFYFVHGSNDPYCDIDDARQLCDQLDGTFIEIENGHHLGDASGVKELPELISALEADGIV